jgi:acetolactate synthase I/II/III large subunit
VPVRGSEIIAEYLEREGVEHVFALCGHGNIGMLDALYDHRDAISTVSVHHAQVAGHMADAYFRAKGAPAATLTSCGPGSANLPVAIASAMMDSSAVLAITGNVPTQQFNRDPFQETGRHYQGDFPSVLRPYVKRSFQPTRAEQLPLVLRQAFVLLREGRPGPVHVDVPLNLFDEETDEAIPDAAAWTSGLDSRAGAPHDAVLAMAAMLRGAERPVLLAGDGVEYHDAAAELQRFAELSQIPVITAPNAKGVLPAGHDLLFGPIGRNGTYAANEAARKADVVVSLSCTLDDRTTSAWIDGFTFTSRTRFIQVHIDERELSKNYPAEIGVLAHPGTVLEQLGRELEQEAITPPDGWLAKLRSDRDTWSEDMQPGFTDDRFPVHPQRLVSDVQRALPDESTVLSDVGVHHNWIVQFWDVPAGGKLLESWGFASMGFGVAGVLGAKLARPEAPAVVICGDAGFTMTSSVLATAVENDIPAVWVVWDNQAYGSIHAMQKGFYGDRELATSFYSDGVPYSPDFAAMARSFGADGISVQAPDEIGDAVQSAVDSGRPTVVHVPTAGDVHPIATGGWVLPPHEPIRPTYRFSE